MRLSHDCWACKAREERVFTDTYTGHELCLECILTVGSRVTNSPMSEGDNLEDLLRKEVMDDEPDLDRVPGSSTPGP